MLNGLYGWAAGASVVAVFEDAIYSFFEGSNITKPFPKEEFVAGITFVMPKFLKCFFR